MYVTRPLSLYRRSPATMEVPVPDAPYSGYLVITDEEAEAEDSCCWGLCQRNKLVKKLPFAQDKIFTIVHSSERYRNSAIKVVFIPVPDQPLSSNRYFVIRANGRNKGKACKCARERDIVSCCLSNLLSDKKPKSFNLKDLYQIFKIHTHQSGFFARSIVSDGIAPTFLRTKGWTLHSSSTSYSKRSCRKLSEALGVDTALRSQLPRFHFPYTTHRSAPVVVGRWYCPFIFVREGVSRRFRRQMKKSIFYSMTLQQRWEEIYSGGRHEITMEGENGAGILVNADVEREVVMVRGMMASKSDRVDPNGFYWYRAYDPRKRIRASVGLNIAIVENMRWVQEEGGRACGRERVVRIREQVRRLEGSEWQKLSCYVMVESFCLRRLDGRLLLRYDFRHTQKIRYKWE